MEIYTKQIRHIFDRHRLNRHLHDTIRRLPEVLSYCHLSMGRFKDFRHPSNRLSNNLGCMPRWQWHFDLLLLRQSRHIPNILSNCRMPWLSLLVLFVCTCRSLHGCESRRFLTDNWYSWTSIYWPIIAHTRLIWSDSYCNHSPIKQDIKLHDQIRSNRLFRCNHY